MEDKLSQLRESAGQFAKGFTANRERLVGGQGTKWGPFVDDATMRGGAGLIGGGLLAVLLPFRGFSRGLIAGAGLGLGVGMAWEKANTTFLVKQSAAAAVKTVKAKVEGKEDGDDEE